MQSKRDQVEPFNVSPGVRASLARGFTLIELLVTVAIVAIILGVVVVSVDFKNVGKSMSNEARRTGLLMQLASDQAVYSRQQFGIRFHPDSYSFYILTTDEEGEEEWQIYEDEQLRFREPEVGLDMLVDISGLPIVLENLIDELTDATKENPIRPHIIFLSNGEIIPDFRILMSDTGQEFQYEVASGDLFPVTVQLLSGS